MVVFAVVVVAMSVLAVVGTSVAVPVYVPAAGIVAGTVVVATFVTAGDSYEIKTPIHPLPSSFFSSSLLGG